MARFCFVQACSLLSKAMPSSDQEGKAKRHVRISGLLPVEADENLLRRFALFWTVVFVRDLI